MTPDGPAHSCAPAIPPLESSEPVKKARRGRIATTVFSVLTISIAIIALRRVHLGWQWAHLLVALRSQPVRNCALSATFTLISFIGLGVYDVLGCRVVVPGRVRLLIGLFAGAVGNAISNTLGFHAVTGTAVRLRIYRRCGIALGDALRIVSLSWLAIGLGFASLIAMAGILGTRASAAAMAFHFTTSAGLAVVIAAFLIWLPKNGRTVRLWGIRLECPQRRIAWAFIAAGLVENGAAIAALYVLLPASAPPFMAFAFSYACAVAAGIASQVPGGLGVFEATLIALWGARVGPDLIPALAAYRVIYNLLPCVLATISLGAWEWTQARPERPALSSKAGNAG